MPHSTCKYRFELLIRDWAGSFGSRLCGSPYYTCFVAFSNDGAAKYVVFGNAPERSIDRDRLQNLMTSEWSWFFFDPFEGPAYQFAAWQNVQRDTIERLMDAWFRPQDFNGSPLLGGFPVTWHVMF